MKRKKLGIFVSDLFASQLSFYSMCLGNKISKQNIDYAIFFENLSHTPIQHSFSLMNIVYGYSWNGTAIATNLSTAQKLIKCPGPKRKIYYIWDLEWLRYNPKLPYEFLASIYQHPSLELVVRSYSHKKIIENAWNREVKDVVSDFEFGVDYGT